MRNRNIIGVLLFPEITFGIYAVYWYLSVAGEMKQRGVELPHWIFLFLPVINIYYLLKFGEGVAKVTNEGFSMVTSFLLLLFLGPIGMAIIQTKLNEAP